MICADHKLLRCAWKIATESGITQDEWEAWRDYFAASTLWPVAKHGELIGVIMLHGMPDGKIMLHTIIKPEWHVKWVTKDIIKAFRGWKPGVDVVTLSDGKDKAARLFGFRTLDREPVGNYNWFIKEA